MSVNFQIQGSLGEHYHALGVRCECGFLSAPSRFHWEDKKEVSQKEAEKRYLEWLSGNMPDHPLLRNSPENNVTRVTKMPPVTKKEVVPSEELPVRRLHGSTSEQSTSSRVTGGRRGRPRKYESDADKQRAYRERR